jgi:cobalamin-dependent methionine synthase I
VRGRCACASVAYRILWSEVGFNPEDTIFDPNTSPSALA